jgi:murein DD-endopeptidase MepM/ murein hydrolase activator NlpD
VKLSAAHPEPELITVRHVVRPGQTLYRIAHAYGLSVDELAAANGISDPTSIQVGQELLIPGAERTVDVEAAQEPEAHPKPATPLGTNGSPLRPARVEPHDDGSHKGTLDWPLRGVLYGRFGKKGKEAHDGIDLAAPAGTAIKAAADGTVLYAGEQRGYGQIAILEHEGSLVTLYAHDQALRVKAGQKVHRGELIATVGESGRTTGPHLHFEVRKGGVPVNPLDYLGPIPVVESPGR